MAQKKPLPKIGSGYNFEAEIDYTVRLGLIFDGTTVRRRV
jgi:hypothetical protein